MRRDDVDRALDALASDVAAPPADAGAVMERGRQRVSRRRVAVFGVVASLVVVVAGVGVFAHDDNPKPPGAHPVEREAGPVAGARSTEIVVPTPNEAWKCSNPIEYTDDGGQTWRATELPQILSGGVSCTAIAGGTAWATFVSVKSRSWVVARIRNGGRTVDIYEFPGAIGRHLQPRFVDSQNGWMTAAPFGGPLPTDLYRTTDGGETWALVAKEQHLRPPSFASDRDGWSTDGRNVYATSDGGASWRIVHRDSLSLFSVVAIPGGAVVWGGRLIQGGQYKDFFDVTIDGGTTWTRRETPYFEVSNGFNFFNASDATHWQQSSGNAIRVTNDAGQTWETRPDMPGGVNGPFTVRFPTADVFWFTNERGEIFRTSDGGRTWDNVTTGGDHPVAPPAQPVPIPLAFVSPSEGWLCSGGTMLYTTDAGATWKYVAVPSHPPTPPRSQVPVCAATPGGDAWMLTTAADATGLQVIHVSDRGRHVETSAFPQLRSDWTVRDLAFADKDHGWAYASDAEGGAFTMFGTADGGRTWQDDQPVRGVTVFASPREGWAALELLPSELAHTTDGGRTWVRVPVTYDGGKLRPIGATGDTVVALDWAPDVADARPSLVVAASGGELAHRGLPRELAAADPAQIAAGVTDADHWQIASGSHLWTTDTGGRTWREVADFAGVSAITDVHFLTPETGFVSATGAGAVANGTVVWRTTDGGGTWSLVAGHAPSFGSDTAASVHVPGGIIGCPTRQLVPPPAGNPPAGLIEAAKQYVGPGPNGWTPDTIQAYRLGANPSGSFGYLFRYQVSSCGPATMANGWVVEMHGPAIKGRAYIPRAYLAFAHYADGWHVIGRYP